MPLNHHFPMVFLWFSLNPFSSNAPFDHRLPQILRQGLEQFGLYLPPEDRAHEKARSMKSHVMYWEFCKAMDRYLMICMYLFIKLCMYLSMYVIIHIIYRRYKYIYIHTYIHTSSYSIYTHHIGLSQNKGYPKIDNFKLKKDTNHGT